VFQVLRYADLTIFGVLIATGAGLWLQRRQKGLSAWLLRAGWMALFLVSWFPFAALMMGTLEWRSPTRPTTNPGAQAMVVLSGGLNVSEPPEPPVLESFSTETRCRHAAWLYTHGWRMQVIVSGGEASRGFNYATLMEDILRKEGVPAETISKEGASTSTYESALYVARLLQPKGIRKILLVTEAYHMPRAAGLFRHAGFDVIASPCSFRTREFRGEWQEWLLLSPRFIQMTENALHEWLSWSRSRLTGQL
jgi:uncharacterized SAM-binding protein YcdF (DUF218 family)